MVLFGQSVDDLGDVNNPTILGEKYDLVILADGGFSQLRQFVTDVNPEYGGYVLYRGLLPLKELPEFSSGFVGNPGYPWFHGGFVVGTRQNALINFGCYMAIPESEVPKPEIGANR